MKLKELFEKELVSLSIRTDGSKSYEELNTLVSIFTRITGKMSHYLSIPSVFKTYNNVHTIPSKEESDRLQKIFEDIISEFGLESKTNYLVETKGEDYYSPRFLGYDKNSSLEYKDLFRYGEGIICVIMYESFNSVPIISGVLYTEESKEIAKKIWCKYSEECYNVVKDYKEDIVDSYEITTVVSDPKTGCYDTYITNISPIVSLTSPDFLYNYNKDFPESRIKDFFEMDKGGIMIFNGRPGCGKSTYLKSLIFKYTNINFVILPQYFLLGQENFRNLLFRMANREKDCVFIIEDCEQLLVQRENNSGQFSSIISDILNYTDGIFGDLTRTKFIFTFNTDLHNIDKALLRPGRLFLKYEFTPLIGENLEKIASKIGYTLSDEEKKNGVPLSELYSKTKTEDLLIEGRSKKRRIGFSATDEISVEEAESDFIESLKICDGTNDYF